jgi:hypothetical protein
MLTSKDANKYESLSFCTASDDTHSLCHFTALISPSINSATRGSHDIGCLQPFIHATDICRCRHDNPLLHTAINRDTCTLFFPAASLSSFQPHERVGAAVRIVSTELARKVASTFVCSTLTYAHDQPPMSAEGFVFGGTTPRALVALSTRAAGSLAGLTCIPVMSVIGEPFRNIWKQFSHA